MSSLTGLVTTLIASCQFKLVSQAIVSQLLSSHFLMYTLSISIVSLNQLREIQSLVILTNILILISHCIEDRWHQVQIFLCINFTVLQRVQVVMSIPEVFLTKVSYACEATLITLNSVRQYQIRDSCLVDSCIIRCNCSILLSILISVLSLCSKYCNIRIVQYALNLIRIAELQSYIKLTSLVILRKLLNSDTCLRST